MKKVLTESHLNRIIETVINNVIEEIQDDFNNGLDIKNDIIRGININGVEKAMTQPYKHDNFAELEITSESGTEYLVKVYMDGRYIDGMESGDRDVPNTPPSAEEWVDHIEIQAYDEDINDYVNVPYEKDFELEELLGGYVDGDWTEYDPMDYYYDDSDDNRYFD